MKYAKTTIKAGHNKELNLKYEPTLKKCFRIWVMEKNEPVDYLDYSDLNLLRRELEEKNLFSFNTSFKVYEWFFNKSMVL